MRATNRDAHARRGDVQVGAVERLARLLRDLVLFAVVPDAAERADLRDDVVQDRRGERAVRRLARFLVGQRVEAGAAGAADGLVGRHAHRLQADRAFDRREADAQHDRGAVADREDPMARAGRRAGSPRA